MACSCQWFVEKLLCYRVQNASLLKWLQEAEIVTRTFRDFEAEHGLSSMLWVDTMHLTDPHDYTSCAI
jgi:hypothetical protein